jgi:hypothetical protein
VLVKAFLDDTLVHGNCYACAVGNLVACGLGAKVIKTDHRFVTHIWDNGEDYPGKVHRNTIQHDGWGAFFTTDRDYRTGKKKQEVNLHLLQSERVQRHITVTGYTWEELARIEFAFESADKRKKDRMLNGLMKVVDVLADIHGVDLSVKESAKLQFVKA